MKETTKPYTLIIIDMQYGFTAADSKTLHKKIKREINRAQRTHSDIIFVTYDEKYHGGTFEDLLDYASRNDYDDVMSVEKFKADGGKEIIEILNEDKQHHLKIAGVQTSVCVADTVHTLAKELPNSNIEIMRDCVRDFPYRKGAQTKAWSDLSFMLKEFHNQIQLRA